MSWKNVNYNPKFFKFSGEGGRHRRVEGDLRERRHRFRTVFARVNLRSLDAVWLPGWRCSQSNHFCSCSGWLGSLHCGW